MVRDQCLAEDIFQDVCLKVVKTLRLGNYVEEGKFYSWFKCIAHNMTIDYIRKSRFNKHQSTIHGKEEDIDIFDFISDNDSNILDTMITNQIHSDVKLLIEQLPPEQKEILVLRHYKQWSFKEISEEYDISINTALGRMRYALINLRKLIKEYEIDLAHN